MCVVAGMAGDGQSQAAPGPCLPSAGSLAAREGGAAHGVRGLRHPERPPAPHGEPWHACDLGKYSVLGAGRGGKRAQRRPRTPPGDGHRDSRTGSRSKMPGSCLFGAPRRGVGAGVRPSVHLCRAREACTGPISATRSNSRPGKRTSRAVWEPTGTESRSGIAMTAHPHRPSGRPGRRTGRGEPFHAPGTGRSGHRAGSGWPGTCLLGPTDTPPASCAAEPPRNRRSPAPRITGPLLVRPLCQECTPEGAPLRACALARRPPRARASTRPPGRAAFPGREGPDARQTAPGNRPAYTVAADHGDHAHAC